MYGCFVNSVSLKCKGSISYSFNDYYSFYLDDKCDLNPNLVKPSHCCAQNTLYGVPINPTFLYGQRQSNLIQCSPSRRLILGGVYQGYSRFPVCDYSSNGSYRKCYTLKESSSVGRKGKWGKGRYGSNVDDAEVILSLLTEEVGEECLGVRKRNERRERICSREINVRRVQLEKREKNESGHSFCKSRRKDVKSGALKGTSKHTYESLKVQSRKEDMQQKDDRREEKKEIFSRGESRSRPRSEASSCSSYYSLLGEFESDGKIHDKHDEFAGESSSNYERRDHRESRYDREVLEEVKRNRGYTGQLGVVTKKEDNQKSLYAESSSVDLNLRKKSEKKLDAELTGQTESWNKSSEKRLSLSDYHESGDEKNFNALKRYDAKKEISSLAANMDATRQQHRQISQQGGGLPESRIKYKQFTEVPDTYNNAVEMASGSKKMHSGRDEDLLGSSSFAQNTGGEQLRTDDLVTREEMHRRNSQKLVRSSKFQEIDNREAFISHRQHESRMKNLEDDATVLPRLIDDSKEQHGHADHQVAGQMGPTGEFQQWTGIANTQNINIQNTFISQKISDRRLEIQKESSVSAGVSYPEAIKRTESGKESQGTSSQNGAKVGTNSGKRTGSQDRYSAVVKLDEKRKERYNLIDQRVMHRGTPTDAQRPTRATSGGMSDEATSSSLMLELGSQSMVHQVGVNPNDNTSPSAAARAQLHDEPTSWHRTDDSRSESLERGSTAIQVPDLYGPPALQHEYYGGHRSETHGDPVNLVTHDDVLGSAARLQQSSTQFVGEFANKVRHEVSASEVQMERTSQTKLVNEGESREPKGLGQYSSGDTEQKDHDPMHLSQGSGAKGPSDEMWDVADASVQKPHTTDEVPEATIMIENSAVTRTGRSMWSVISDIVRLRWASNSETNNSRSGGKSSSNRSTSSDAWFSGHEPDENNDENIKQGREVALQDSSSADQGQHGAIQTHNQELSRSKRSKDKSKHVGLGLPSSSISENVSVVKGVLPPTTEEPVAKHSEVTSGTIEPESSLPLPAMRVRRSPTVQEISETSKAETSGSGTMSMSGQQGSSDMTEVSISEGKTGELKQRKLQRNKQVVGDKFDEWEEAYIFEAEQRKNDEMFMREALLEAKKAADIWEVPVGAVLVQHGKIIARGYNLVEELRDSTAHAEMICIREASNVLRSWRLADTTLYVTLEPCPMCAGAILQARIDTIVWGAPNKLLGADGSWIRLFPTGGEGREGSELTAAPVHPFHPNIKLRRGVLASECADVMQQFFQLRRKKKDNKPDQPMPPTPPSGLPISSRRSKFFTKMHDVFHIMFCL